MPPNDLFPSPWLTNTLLDEAFVATKKLDLAQQALPYGLGAWLQSHFDAQVLAKRSEAQLEEKFIGPLLAQLGWIAVPQQVLAVQGKIAKPDWCLVLQPAQEDALVTHQDHQQITAICESKAWGKTLDTGKADRAQNPHHQLQDYLSTLRVRFGFLTNGRVWRVYDTDKVTARKTYIQFDLEAICALGEGTEKTEALALFAFFFGRDTYVPPEVPGRVTAIEQAIAESAEFTLAVEENLKAVIYGYAGEDSLFETMGRAIYRANPKASMAQVYENSVVLLFRLLFVVYFEDKNHELLARHPFYKRYSLDHIFRGLPAHADPRSKLHDGVYALKQLFEMLDEGAEDIDIPLFNGGLFDPLRAPLLLRPKIFDNATLRNVLEKLLYKTERGTTLFDTRRDFKNMSVTHLGRIYEGLLEFRFEKALEAAVYLEYESATTRGKPVEAYFDAYDTALIRKEKGFKALRELSVKKGDVYLKSASNSRKTSASYYTPASLSQPLVKAAVDQALVHAAAQGKALMDLKLLDNACGSGHFLVEALNYLTDLALDRLDTDADLQALVAQERAKIAEQLAFLNLDYVPEDAQILKRALLKRCIFGVDLNPFAVELARLSLWMDSFIFGTPLSFIEHHVQHGNALMGASVQEFIAYNAVEVAQDDFFVENLSARFDELRTVMQELDAMRDTTAQEVEQSKTLWKTRIAPKLKLLGRALSFVCTRRALLAEGDKAGCESLSKTPDLVNELFDESKTKTAAPGLLPLYEGKMIWQYSHVFEQPQYWLDGAAFDQRLHSKELHRMAQDLGVPRAQVEKHAAGVRYDREFVRLGLREVAADTNERSLIFSLLPRDCGLGHTLFANAAKYYVADADGGVRVQPVSALRMLFAMAWFNSLPTDWLARFMIQIHVSKTHLYRLPIPQPSDAEILANADYARLAKNALLLSLAASWNDFAELAPLFNVQRKDLPLTAKAKDLLRAENDRTVARLYGITAAELAHLLRSFKGMATKRPEYLALLQTP